VIHSMAVKHKKGWNRDTICIMGHNIFTPLPRSAETTSSMRLAVLAELLCVVY
jgi:hypothetical protein